MYCLILEITTLNLKELLDAYLRCQCPKLITENAKRGVSAFIEVLLRISLALVSLLGAVEEGIAVIKPYGDYGSLIWQWFVQERLVCNHLLGYRIFSALVEIEKNRPHRLQFFMWSHWTINPSVLVQLGLMGKPGGRNCTCFILLQMSTLPTKPEWIPRCQQFFGFIFCEDDSVADVKIPFLASLANQFEGEFITLFTCSNLVLQFVDEHLAQHLPENGWTSLSHRECRKLMTRQRIADKEAEATGGDYLEWLIMRLSLVSAYFALPFRGYQRNWISAFFRQSDHFELSSLPSSIGVLKYLAGTSLPSHAAIILSMQIRSSFCYFRRRGHPQGFVQNCGTSELFQLADRHPLVEGKLAHEVDFQYLSTEGSPRGPKSDKLIGFSITWLNRKLIVTPGMKAISFKSNYGFPTDNSTRICVRQVTAHKLCLNRLILCCINEGGTLCFPAGIKWKTMFFCCKIFKKQTLWIIPTDLWSGLLS
ncbi:hypothetical protein NC651_012039 [Populus alba x Populus x berolinensis]|nr:hypothetical protein NC651_012039 [Populus alba x Populus x berolinensis]